MSRINLCEPWNSLTHVKNVVVYEQPLNERVRTLLRLAFLFRQATHRLRGTSTWDSRATLASLNEILDVLGRSDLKTELLKELERHQLGLGRLRAVAGVDQERLENILTELGRHQARLHGSTTQLGQVLRDNEFLASLRQRSNIAGGTCDFDLPGYHYWLQQAAEQRVQQLSEWLATLDEIRAPVDLLVNLIRESATPTREQAAAGFFQRALDTATPYQLIRVALPADAQYFAEISGGKHRFSVRFLEPQGHARPRQVEHDVDFQLFCCAL